MEDVALFLHLLGALLFVAGITVAATAFEAARRRTAPSEIALLLGLARAGAVLVGVGGLMLPVFGLWLVHLGGFGFGAAWVSASLALYVVALGLGAAGGQRPKRARLLAARLAGAGEGQTVELRALLDDARSRAVNYVSLAIVVAIVALMVFKP